METSNCYMQSTCSSECRIRNIWKHNLQEEFDTISQLIGKYNHVCMDTEFPGVIIHHLDNNRSSGKYLLMHANVSKLKIIQLGLTLMDENGETPPGYTTWQFNFEFNLREDLHSRNSIQVLENAGIEFEKHENDGIHHSDFVKYLRTSGILSTDKIKWLTFHSSYDFGYMLAMLMPSKQLPIDESDFFKFLRQYFPTIYDVKHLMLNRNLRGGLQTVADQLHLRRVGIQHQAGSDSHLTGMVFFKIKKMFFDDNIDDKYCGNLFGLASSRYKAILLESNYQNNQHIKSVKTKAFWKQWKEENGKKCKK